MTQIEFNTGRQYTQRGQRIVAKKVDGNVYFKDIDRMIEGMFEHDGEVTREVVMAHYDACDYGFVDQYVFD